MQVMSKSRSQLGSDTGLLFARVQVAAVHKLQICKSRISLSHYKINHNQISLLHNADRKTNKPVYAFERIDRSWKLTKHGRVQLELPIFFI